MTESRSHGDFLWDIEELTFLKRHKHIKIIFIKCLNIFNFNKAYDKVAQKT